ncbi:MAG: superoxide dismutase [Saprospiraceae bacterium]|nr:superoxide dismutase [Saprospiraceae bacterium]HMW38586.1 superoxide dismutase [Saprospiraceae bacterium]HMX88787.1 superoxide dismutase [Saprospiraceae bacterium]HMZ40487.1 superoxide dismutase [Saprospiraceae bacterium]HNA64733.1 superoxide dismutase [Saprospiraceae bacterium]
MPFSLPELKYPHSALEPHIDTRTMEIHHGKHHAAYTTNLNNAIKDTPMDSMPIEEILMTLDMGNAAVRNNGGGYYNHNLFWELLSPNGGGEPSDELARAINDQMGGFAAFKDKFSLAGMGRFGSGWAWLNVYPGGKLEIASTPNQDNPLMPGVGGGMPVLALDVWEHAYYLHYQNRRADYIQAFFNVLNWDEANRRFNRFK